MIRLIPGNVVSLASNVCRRDCRDRKQYVMQREVSEQVSDLHRILERSEPTKRG